MVFGFPLLRAGHESGLRVGAHRWGQLAQHRADPPGRYSPTIAIADKLFFLDTFLHTHTPKDIIRTQITIFLEKFRSPTNAASFRKICAA